jgi:hypothetical protein
MTEEETYQIGSVKYHSRFPREWAENHLDGTGPESCGNCADYGSLCGVFIGYCVNCADYVYNGDRGNGLWGGGLDFDEGDGLSIYETYLSGLTLDISATRLVELTDPTAMTDDDLQKYIQEMDEEWNMLEYDYNITENEILENEDTSVFDCHFEGGYNDM